MSCPMPHSAANCFVVLNEKRCAERERRAKTGNILSNLGVSSRWLTNLLYRFFIWRFYRRADCVIAPSLFAANLLRDAGLTRPITVLSNGVTESFFLAPTPVNQ